MLLIYHLYHSRSRLLLFLLCSHIAVGNRILNQLEKIVPAFIACGGTKEDALDFMLCKKLFSKLEGRFEDYVKPALEETLALMDETYGKGTLSRSEKVIRKIIKTL